MNEWMDETLVSIGYVEEGEDEEIPPHHLNNLYAGYDVIEGRGEDIKELTHTYIHTYIHIYIYTYTHIHTYIQTHKYENNVMIFHLLLFLHPFHHPFYQLSDRCG